MILRGVGLMLETCSRSERSLLMVLANTSSLRARWKGSSIIMPRGREESTPDREWMRE